MQWRHEARIDAPADAVYAWMSDHREDDHAREAFLRGAGRGPEGARSRREVVSRDGDVVKLRDVWGKRVFEMEARLDAKAREVRLTGAYGYRATWRAIPDGAGTRLVVEGAIEARGIAGLFAKLFGKRMLRDMQADFNGHVADARETLK
ncbi:MAG: hypothetical protein QOE90_261 [Thermoplasmata archaeon]|jgi:carbon monoxide dehydrogenase subunit G|nr:hypothetical protein [Thermoplasmata archaeon]